MSVASNSASNGSKDTKSFTSFSLLCNHPVITKTQTKVIQVIMFLKIIMGNQKKMLNYREKQLGHRPKMVHREHLLRNVSLMDSFTFFQVCVKTLADGQKNNET